MTPEQRLDRLERIAKLFAKAGLRARDQFRQQCDILMDAQMRNEARFAQNEERFSKRRRKIDQALGEIGSKICGVSRSTS
jgi:crotonobetainyl-CoA:carnitine CoA-transferase CaiB-like acyl-CoA transferase